MPVYHDRAEFRVPLVRAAASPAAARAQLAARLPSGVLLFTAPGQCRQPRQRDRDGVRRAEAQAQRYGWAAPPSLSKSHSAGWGAVCAAPAGWQLGVDIERLEGLSAGVLRFSLAESAFKAGVGPRRFEPANYQWLQGQLPGEAVIQVQGDWITALWAWADRFLMTVCYRAPALQRAE